MNTYEDNGHLCKWDDTMKSSVVPLLCGQVNMFIPQRAPHSDGARVKQNSIGMKCGQDLEINAHNLIARSLEPAVSYSTVQWEF